MNRRKIVVSTIVMMLLIIVSACGSSADNRAEPIPANADIQGTVTSMEGNTLLIVDKEKASPDNKTPTAIWVKFTAVQLEGIKIGYLVKAWSNGILLESYPMQTEGVKLEVVSTMVGMGDLQGKVTDVNLDSTDEMKRYIEVEGQKLRLIPSTDYLLNETSTDANQIKIGDQVELWFPGYQIMDEQVVTQVRIVR